MTESAIAATAHPGASAPHLVTRRGFLVGAAGVGALGALAATVGRNPIESALGLAPARPAVTAAAGTLVLCTLYGGNDGLNTVIPYQDSAYLGGRGSLAYQPNQVIPLADGLALHPSLTAMKKLWDAGHLAIVRGVGYPNPSFSHFRAMDIWQSAVPETDVATGWLGRWLDGTGSDPLRALAVGPTLPLAFHGAKAQAGSIPAGPPSLPGNNQLRAAFTTMETPAPSQPPLQAAAAQSGADLIRISHTLSEALGTSSPTTKGGHGGGGASGGPLATQLNVVAKLIRAGVPTRAYGVSLGGFDTHANEKETQARLLSEVDQAVSSFVDGLASDPRGRGTVVVVYSEFGRRVASNASGGTDHGSAAPVLVAGSVVKGGFYGEEPSLANLDDGNLRFTTDFRSVYATVLERVVGVDPKLALGKPYPTVGFL